MGLFSSKPKAPKQVTCPCGIGFPEPETLSHYDTHLVEVVANNDQTAFAFDCPKCGMSSQAWGHEDAQPARKRERARMAMAVHMMERHGISLPV
jgi:hypothetical protein